MPEPRDLKGHAPWTPEQKYVIRRRLLAKHVLKLAEKIEGEIRQTRRFEQHGWPKLANPTDYDILLAKLQPFIDAAHELAARNKKAPNKRKAAE